MNYNWRRQTIAETFERLRDMPSSPWVPKGDFLDDWRRSEPADRLELVIMGLDEQPGDAENLHLHRWATFCAATVEWLCWNDGLPFPAWTGRADYSLAEPWFLYPGDALRPWQLATTPAPFKMRNIFGGDRILDRV